MSEQAHRGPQKTSIAPLPLARGFCVGRAETTAFDRGIDPSEESQQPIPAASEAYKCPPQVQKKPTKANRRRQKPTL
jgi:hypothetical protein